MKTICFLLFSLIFISSAAQTSNEAGFTINGTITGIVDNTDVSLEDANTKAQVAKAKIANGKFTLTGKLAEPALCWLKITGENQVYVYAENSVITVTGKKPLAQNIIVSGSSAHNDFAEFQSIFNPLISRNRVIVQAINSSPYGAERDSMMNIYNKIGDTIQQQIDLYINRHLTSYVSPFILFVTNDFKDDPMLLESRYNRLDTNVKAAQISVSLKGFIEYNKVGAVGTNAIDFTQPDTSGKNVSLYSFKGKYVLVDFWASWCGPCRMENPNVVASYQKFKEKNFTVLGVSLDRPGKKEDWINAIYKDNLTWTHVSDLQFWNNAAAKLYRVSGIPFNFLMDPQGKIIGRNLRGPELESKLCEVLGCN